MKQGQEQKLSIRRSEFLRSMRITVKNSHKTKDLENLLSIQTFNPAKRQVVELVMRSLNDLDSLATHIVNKHGGHIIPILKQDVFFEKKPEALTKKVEDYLVQLQHNKYCRQDSLFYCFLLQQNAVFPKQMTYDKVLRNAADLSRKYLNTFFTRKSLPEEKMKEVITTYRFLKQRIQEYEEVKEVSLIKVKQFLLLEETMGLFAEITAVPCAAIQPQEEQIEGIWKLVKSTDSLLQQAGQAHTRWQILIENVREIQSNVYKGLHQDAQQLELKTKQLQEWNTSLNIQFEELAQYLSEKMDRIAKTVYKLKRKIIDIALLTSAEDLDSPLYFKKSESLPVEQSEKEPSFNHKSHSEHQNEIKKLKKGGPSGSPPDTHPSSIQEEILDDE